MKKNVLVTILTCVAFALIIVIATPFKLESVGNGEGIIKTIILPLLIVALALSILLIRRKNKEVNKLATTGASMAILGALAAEGIFMATLPLRNHSMGSDIALNDEAWKLLAFAFLFTFCVAVCLAIAQPFFKSYKSKAAIPPILYGFVGALLAASVFNCVLTTEYTGGSFATSAGSTFAIAIVLAVLTVAGFVLEFLFVNKKQEVEEPSSDVESFHEICDEYLDELYKNSREELVLRGRLPQEETPALEKVEETPTEEVVEESPALEKVEETPTEEVVVEAPVEKQPKPEKEKKVIEPSVAALAEYAQTFDDVNITYAKDNQENYKVFRGKKLMCIVQSTKNDYRITFQRKPISVANLIIKYPNLITRANKPEGEQWFKAINKGNIEEEDLKIMIRFSHKYLVDAEAKELAKKEKAKQKAKEKREKERAKEKEKREKERAKEKERARREKEKADALAAKQAKQEQKEQEAPSTEA